MLPSYYMIEAMRIAAERQAEADRLARRPRRPLDAEGAPNRLRRAGARVALGVGRQSLRLARALDECAADGSATRSGASPLG
jgi:hypothetical protein